MKRKAVFLDRDDTLIADPGYLSDPAQVKLISGAAPALAALQKMGYLLIVVTNQSGVARGYFTEQQLEQIHHHLKKLLADEGVYLDAIYYCPYHPEGTVAEYAKESDWRKPQPGMLLQAAKDFDIDLSQSWMIGDSYRDIAAGKRAGCKTILLDTPGKLQVKSPEDPEPDKRAVNLREAVNILRMLEFQQKALSARHGSAATAAVASPAPIAPPVEPTPPPTAPPSQPPAAKPASASARRVEPVPSISAPTEKPTAPTVPSSAEPTSERPAEPLAPPAASASAAATPTTSAVATPAPKSHTAPTAAHPAEIPRQDVQPRRTVSQEMQEDFSVFVLLAWLVQALAMFCLVLSIWYWLDSSQSVQTVQTMVLYAIALQLLTLALLRLHEKR